MTPIGGMWWILAAALLALLFAVGYAQNRRCKLHGRRAADCECES